MSGFFFLLSFSHSFALFSLLLYQFSGISFLFIFSFPTQGREKRVSLIQIVQYIKMMQKKITNLGAKSPLCPGPHKLAFPCLEMALIPISLHSNITRETTLAAEPLGSKSGRELRWDKFSFSLVNKCNEMF